MAAGRLSRARNAVKKRSVLAIAVNSFPKGAAPKACGLSREAGRPEEGLHSNSPCAESTAFSN